MGHSLVIGSREYTLAGGTTTGSDHIRSGRLLLGRPNQDAYIIGQNDTALVGICCDGCGSGEHSEFGSRLAVNFLLTSILDHIEMATTIGPHFLRFLENDMLRCITNIARVFHNTSYSSIINDYFLFTIVAIIIHESGCHILTLGDGAILRPETPLETRSYPGNIPPYLAYNLVRTAIDPSLLRLNIESIPLDEAFPILIGTDGLEHLDKLALRTIHHTNECIGPLDQFFSDKYFTNDQAISRRLLRINSELTQAENGRVTRMVGPLPDDTTLIVARVRDLQS